MANDLGNKEVMAQNIRYFMNKAGKPRSDVEDGDVAIVLINESDGTYKRVKKYSDSLALLPLNPTYEPLIYSKDDVAALQVKIIGKVVELRGKF